MWNKSPIYWHCGQSICILVVRHVIWSISRIDWFLQWHNSESVTWWLSNGVQKWFLITIFFRCWHWGLSHLLTFRSSILSQFSGCGQKISDFTAVIFLSKHYPVLELWFGEIPTFRRNISPHSSLAGSAWRPLLLTYFMAHFSILKMFLKLIDDR